jgi:hypothetical protein
VQDGARLDELDVEMSPLNQLAVSQADPFGPPEPSKPSKKLVACALRCRPMAATMAMAPFTMEVIILLSPRCRWGS